MYSQKQKRQRIVAAFFYRARMGRPALFSELKSKALFIEFWERFEKESAFDFNEDSTGIVCINHNRNL